MEIIVNNKFKLVTQEYGYDLIEIVKREKRIKEKGVLPIHQQGSGEIYEVEECVGYFTDIESVIKRIAHRTLHSKKMKVTLQEFISEYNYIIKEIKEYVKGVL